MDRYAPLNQIEHSLLSMQVDDSEPLFILYADTKRDFENTDLDTILKSIIKLVELGYSKCLVHKDDKWDVYDNISLKDLQDRFAGLSEKEKLEYPIYIDEYYFQITEMGRIEEAKEIYDRYYPD